MKLSLFSIYDGVAESYIPPFTLTNSGMAKREFIAATNDPNHKFCQHPQDYTLYELGTFDDQTGLILTHKTQLKLMNGMDAKIYAKQAEELKAKHLQQTNEIQAAQQKEAEAFDLETQIDGVEKQ
ncbi:UNVERIFIED_CONTAM: hypothetical protein GTU68_008480 [Idotea baltica]|nr:hypothetical protein [Idotea baltica]